jgi:predicted dithiol-disulfide oxidoreductase (DUF899 family)
MFGPDYTAGCPSCSAIADGFNGSVVHLANHDVTLMAVSRVSFTETQQRDGVEYNYRRSRQPADMKPAAEGGGDGAVAQLAAIAGTDAASYARERPGMSAFVLEDGVVYHASSAYSRGVDGIWAMYQWLDRAPKGRNETGPWWRRHDEYAQHSPAVSA